MQEFLLNILLQSHQKKYGFQVFNRQVEGSSLYLWKAVAKLPWKVEVVFHALKDRNMARKIEPNVITMESVQTFDENHFIEYSQSIMPWPYQNRDWVHEKFIHFDEQISYFLNISTRHPNKPHIKGYIRGHSFLVAHVIEKDPQDATHCILTNISHTDMRGSAPVWLTNAGSKTIMHQLKRIYEIIKESQDKVVNLPEIS